MEKVYAVIIDEAEDGTPYEPEIYIFDTKEKASEKLAELSEMAKDTRFDTTEYVEGESFEMYMEGWYDREHYRATLREVPINAKE